MFTSADYPWLTSSDHIREVFFGGVHTATTEPAHRVSIWACVCLTPVFVSAVCVPPAGQVGAQISDASSKTLSDECGIKTIKPHMFLNRYKPTLTLHWISASVPVSRRLSLPRRSRFSSRPCRAFREKHPTRSISLPYRSPSFRLQEGCWRQRSRWSLI